MSAQVYSLPGQAELRRNTFLEGASLDLSSELSLTYEGNVNHCKSLHHPLSTLLVGIGNTLEVFKTN